MILRASRRATAALAVAALALAGCGSADTSTKPAQGGDGPLTVVASTDVWGSVADAVGGDAVQVSTIIDDPSADPHSYESTPQDTAEVTRADLVVFNGGGYDEFMAQILQAGDAGAAVVEAVAVAGAPSSGHANEGGADEHVWYDLATVEAVARAVADELAALAPDRAATFTASAQAFREEINGVAEQVSTIRQQHAGKRVVVTEPLALHLIEAAGLDDVTPPEFVEAVEEETDPPAAAVAETRRLVSGSQVTVLVFTPQTETPVTAQVRADAEAAGIPVVAMAETLPQNTGPQNTGYVDWMSGQVQALAAALQRSAVPP